MMKRRWRLVYEPTAAVYHSHNESPEQLFDRFCNEASARIRIDPTDKRFTKRALAWDWFAGTGYDLATALVKHRSARWAWFALKRRYWINLGRYFGSRHMARFHQGRPLSRVLLRFVLVLMEYVNDLFQRMAPHVVARVHRDLGPMHPRRLMDVFPGRYWFVDQIRGAERVLEVQCGQGGNLLRASREAEQVYGFDPDKHALFTSNFLARWEERNNVTLVAAKEWAIPFGDETFDCLMAFEVFSDPKKRTKRLLEIVRVLRTGGKLLLTVGKKDSRYGNLKRDLGLHATGKKEHRVVVTEQEMVDALAPFGLKLVSSQPSDLDSPLVPFTDLLGAFSPSLYMKLLAWRYRAALRHPSRSRGLRMVFVRTGKKGKALVEKAGKIGNGKGA